MKQFLVTFIIIISYRIEICNFWQIPFLPPIPLPPIQLGPCTLPWLPLVGINPCMCVNSVTPPAGTTYLSSQQYCKYSVDSRSGLLEFNGDAGLAPLSVALTSVLSIFGISNIPVGIYTDNTGALRHIGDQSITPPVASFVGHCGYIFLSGSFVYNMSCLQQPPQLICVMGCNNPAYPPTPVTGPDALRCNTPNFMMSSCPAGWINLGGLCYINPVNKQTLSTYSEAVSTCAAAGGWLPTFVNLKEWQAVVSYAYYTGISGVDSYAAPMWLGGTLNGTSATWNDGTPWSFSYWAPYQPTATSTCMWWSVGQANRWSTGICDYPGVVFCQYYSCSTSSTSTTTTVTTAQVSTSSSTITTTTSPTTTTITSPNTTTTTTSPTTTSTTSPDTTTTPPSTTTTPPSTTTTTTSPTTTSTTLPDTTTTPPSTTTTTTSPTTTSTTSPNTTTMPPSTTTTTTSLSTISSAIDTTTNFCLSKIANDFSQSCRQKPHAFYLNGICYQLRLSNSTFTDAENDCLSTGDRLAIIRSPEVGYNVAVEYLKANSMDPNPQVWIKFANYSWLQHSTTLDGAAELTVNVATGQCVALSWAIINTNMLFISDSTSCIMLNAYICETRSEFLRQGCGQALSRKQCVIGLTQTAASIDSCGQLCSYKTWCSGFNYNPTTQTCEQLTDNSTNQEIICDADWYYFERVLNNT